MKHIKIQAGVALDFSKINRSEMIDTGERADHCPILLDIDL